MIGKIARRREERTAELVATAWALARTQGIAGLSLHALARESALRQPSLYVYFESKHALYDAMFADGNRRLLERLRGLDLPSDPRAAVKVFMRTLAEFVVEDVALYALLFQRPIPGFEPSPESYALAGEVLGASVDVLAAAGLSASEDVDCYVAMVAGLTAAQSANEPNGVRWLRHLERLTDLYLDDAEQRRHCR